MKIRCDGCGKKFDPAKTDGICPYCGAWHSPPEDQSFDAAQEADPWEEDFAGAAEQEAQEAQEAREAREREEMDAPDEEEFDLSDEEEEEEQERLRRMAAARAAAAVLPRQQRPKRYGPLVLLIVLTVLLLAAVVAVPPLAGGWFERQAIARGRVEDPTVTPAQGEAAVAAPFTYRLTGADWIDYDGPWQMPEDSRLLRVELAVSMAGGEPDWDPEDPYLALDDGSYRMALPYYQLEEILDEEDPALGAFPYEVYWLETPGEAAACSFYYLVPAQTEKATICFERYSADRYGVRLEEIAELPFTIAGEGAQG